MSPTVFIALFVCASLPYSTRCQSAVNCQTYRNHTDGYIFSMCMNVVLDIGETLTFKQDVAGIIFKDSYIPVLNGGKLQNSQSIKALRISNSKLCLIEKDTFSSNTKLEIIQLVGNCISVIVCGVYNNLLKLKILDLSSNNITTIENGSFDGLLGLQMLNLSSNFIAVITNKTFNSLKGLYELDLSNNKITILSEDVFVQLGSLQKLTLSQNFLLDVGFLLCTNKDINRLDLSHNNVSLAGSPFKHFQRLGHLDLSSTEIAQFETDLFVGLTELKVLKLNGNKLRHLCENCFGYLISLQELHLSNNALDMVDFSTFLYLEKLETLALDYNNLNRTHSNFVVLRFPNVKSITINNNAWSCNALLDTVNILVKKNVSFAAAPSLLFNETNIRGISCSNHYHLSQESLTHTQKMTMEIAQPNFTTHLLLLLVLNTCLLGGLIVFHIVFCFCKWRVKHVKPKITKTTFQEFEVINDLYNMQ